MPNEEKKPQEVLPEPEVPAVLAEGSETLATAEDVDGVFRAADKEVRGFDEETDNFVGDDSILAQQLEPIKKGANEALGELKAVVLDYKKRLSPVMWRIVKAVEDGLHNSYGGEQPPFAMATDEETRAFLLASPMLLEYAAPADIAEVFSFEEAARIAIAAHKEKEFVTFAATRSFQDVVVCQSFLPKEVRKDIAKTHPLSEVISVCRETGFLAQEEVKEVVQLRSEEEWYKVPPSDIAVYLDDSDAVIRCVEHAFPEMTLLLDDDPMGISSEEVDRLPQKIRKALGIIISTLGSVRVAPLLTKESMEDFIFIIYSQSYNLEGVTERLGNFNQLPAVVKKSIPTHLSSYSVITRIDPKTGREVSDAEGLAYQLRIIDEFYKKIEVVPVDMREGLFEYLQLGGSRSLDVRENSPQLTSEEVDSYVAYINMLPDGAKLSLADLVRDRSYFSAENFAIVQSGVQSMKDVLLLDASGIEFGKTDGRSLLALFFSAGEPDAGMANVFVKKCIETGRRSFVDTRQRGYGSYDKNAVSLKQRDVHGIRDIYSAFETYRKYFSTDRDLMYEYLGVPIRQQRLIDAVSDGTLLSEGESADFSVVEGDVRRFTEDIVYHSKGPKGIDRFRELSRMHKELFLSSKKVFEQKGCWVFGNSDNLLGHVVSEPEKVQRCAEFLRRSTLDRIPDVLLDEMSARPECAPIFDVLCVDAFKKYANDGDDTTLKSLVSLCIELHDLGISPITLRYGDKNIYDKLRTWDTRVLVSIVNDIFGQTGESVDIQYVINIPLQKRDPQFVSRVATIAALGNGEYEGFTLSCDMQTLDTYGESDESDMSDDQNDQGGAMDFGDLLRKIELQRKRSVLGIKKKYSSQEIETQYQHALGVKKILTRIEGVLGQSIPLEKKGVFWDMSETVVDFLCAHPDVLQTMMDARGVGRFDIDPSIITIPITYLKDPIFWKMGLYKQKEYLTEQHVVDVLALVPRLKSYGVYISEDTIGFYSKRYDEIASVFGHAPWLFEERVVRQFDGNMALLCDMSELSQEMFEHVYRVFVSRFDFSGADTGRFKNKLKDICEIVEKSDNPQGILIGWWYEQRMGLPIPFDIFVDIPVVHLDEWIKIAREGGEFEKYSWENERKLKTLKHRLDVYDAKKQLISAGITDEVFLDVCAEMVVASGSVDQVAAMDTDTRLWCANVWRMQRGESRTNSAYFLTYLELSKRPDREEVVRLRSLAYEQNRESCYIEDFLRSVHGVLTKDMVDRYASLPPYVTISPIDVVMFFSHPDASAVLSCLTRMWEKFGGQGEVHTLRVVDILSIRYQDVMQYLDEFEKQSFYPLTLDQLRAVPLLCDERYIGSIRKIIHMFDGVREAGVPYGELIESVRHLSNKDEANAILRNNVCTWQELIQYKDDLVGFFGWSEMDIGEMANAIFSNTKSWGGYRLPEIPLPADILIALISEGGDLVDLLGQIGSSQHIDASVKDEVFFDSRVQDKLRQLCLYGADHTHSSENIRDMVRRIQWKYLIPIMRQDTRILQYIARERSFVDVVDHKDLFSAKEIHDIAKNVRSISEVLIHRSLFSPEELIELLTDKSDEVLSSVPLSDICEYVPHDRLVTVAKRRPFSEAVDLKDIFSSREILDIANERNADEIVLHTKFILDTYLECDDVDLIRQYNRLIIIALSGKYPDIKHVLTDPNKMGSKIGVFADRLTKYAHEVFGAENDRQVAEQKIVAQLRNIKKIYSSTDSSETDRRLIFAEGLSARNPETGIQEVVNEEVKERVRGHVHDILIRSGSVRELHSMRQRLRSRKMSPEERQTIKDELGRADSYLRSAHERNVALYTHALEKPEENGGIILPEGSFTHGAPFGALENILDDGVFCGELLGSAQSKVDSSGLFGTDTCRVPEGKGALFTERLQLGNEGYGDVIFVFGQYDTMERTAYVAGVVGKNHYNIPYGIPSTEITSIVVKRTDLVDATKVKVAEKGIFIPIVDNEGNQVFTPEEFSEMKLFFADAKKQGYPVEVMAHVYKYYKNRSAISNKHRAVIEKAVEAMKSGTVVDLPVLVETLKADTLNWHDDEWYESQSFDVIYAFFVSDRTRRAQREVQSRLFGVDVGEKIYKETSTDLPNERIYHAHLDAFLDRQLPNTDVDRMEVLTALADLAMRPLGDNDIVKASNMVTEVKKQILGNILEVAWQDAHVKALESGIDEARWQQIAASITPALSGSLGRHEAVLGSDLDFLFVFDDDTYPDVDIATVKKVIDEYLTPVVSDELKKVGIRPDAGLAKADKNPFTKLSDIRALQIDLAANRQAEEPTEIMDMEAVSVSGNSVVERAKYALLVENKDRDALVSYIERDLEVGVGKKSFIQDFEDLYRSFASGMDMSHVKESMQRVVAFKIYDLVLRAFSEHSVSQDEAKHIPGSSVEKISWLLQHGVLSDEEAKICRDMLACAYKLRMMSEFFSAESNDRTEDNIPKKVKQTNLQQRALSFEDRQFIFSSIKGFRDTVLYK